MPSNHGGRIPYTRDDDVLLAKFIANYNPGPRGRGGNTLYKKLVENAEGKWSWSSRHTWQSWRDRYYKNSEWFDSQILKYQKKHNIDPDKPPAKDKKVAKRRRQSNSLEESELTGEEKPKTRTTMGKDKAGARQEGDAKAGKRRKVEDVKVDTREEDMPGMKVEEDHASQVLNEGESRRVEEAEAAPIASTLSEDDREVHAKLSKSEKLYPALDTLPSPTLAPLPVPGSFDTPRDAAKKPKLKPKLRPAADDPFASSPSPSPSATTDRRPPHRSPPKLLQRPFRGPIHFSSPPRRRNDNSTESDPVDQPHWPSIRAVPRRPTKVQPEVAEDHPVSPVVGAPAEAPKTPKVSPPVQTNLETSGPRDVGIAVPSSSKVTLNTPGRLTTSHQATDQIKDKPLDLVAVELRRQKSVDYRRQTSKRSELTRVGELSAQNLEHHGRLLQLKDEGRRHSIAGMRPNLKADDLRVGSLRRSACSSRSSLTPSTSFIVPGQHATVSGSSIPSEERDLVATLGVNSALSMLAKKQGFSEEVAWGVWGKTKSIKRTERVLLAMHEAAESARQQAIEVLGGDRSMDVDINDASSPKLEGKPVSASLVGDFDRDDRALKATPIVQRRQYPPFHYTPTQEPEQPYLPPSSTRAGKTARLFSQGRVSEALERAKRSAKRSEYPTPDKNLTHEGFDADLEGKLGTQDLFKWGEEHDDLFLHAGPETEDALAELERQVDDDKLIRQKFLHALSILHP